MTKPDGMMWQEYDPEMPLEETIRYAVQHFTLKYEQPVVEIACHTSVDLGFLSEKFPEITFEHDDKLFHASLFYVYGAKSPEHPELRNA